MQSSVQGYNEGGCGSDRDDLTAVEGGEKWLGFSKFYLEGGVNILP